MKITIKQIFQCLFVLFNISTIPRKDILWVYITVFLSIMRDPKAIFNRKNSESTNFLSDYLPHKIIVKSPTGVKFLARPKYEDLARYLFAENVAKWEPLKIINLKKNDIVVDIGANTGYYTLRLSSRIGENGKIIAIEPDPETFDVLKENCKLNNISNVDTYNIAISDSNGEMIFRQSMSHSGTSSLYINSNKKLEVNEMVVKTTTLDELFDNKFKEITWVKIDVEGAELAVLRGASNTLGKIKNIIIEVHEHILKENNENSEEIVKILKEHGFKITLLNEFWDKVNSPNQILKSDYILGERIE